MMCDCAPRLSTRSRSMPLLCPNVQLSRRLHKWMGHRQYSYGGWDPRRTACHEPTMRENRRDITEDMTPILPSEWNEHAEPKCDDDTLWHDATTKCKERPRTVCMRHCDATRHFNTDHAPFVCDTGTLLTTSLLTTHRLYATL